MFAKRIVRQDEGRANGKKARETAKALGFKEGRWNDRGDTSAISHAFPGAEQVSLNVGEGRVHHNGVELTSARHPIMQGLTVETAAAARCKDGVQEFRTRGGDLVQMQTGAAGFRHYSQQPGPSRRFENQVSGSDLSRQNRESRKFQRSGELIESHLLFGSARMGKTQTG